MRVLLFFSLFLALSKADYETTQVDLKIPENIEEFMKKVEDFDANRQNSRILNGRNVETDTEWPFTVEATVSMAGRM